MKVEFVGDGGFGKSGGFIEYKTDKTGEEPVYQRGGYLTVNMKCRDVLVSDHIGSVNEGDAEIQSRISATGDFEDALWGSWRLAMMGSDRTHQSVHVSIRQSLTDQVAFFAGGMRASDRDDVDANHDESFYVEAVILPSQFKHLLDVLSDGPCHLHLRVAFGKFPKFLAQWSPSISDGRTIKYLNSNREISNESELPEGFFQEAVGNEAISITVAKPIPTIHQATSSVAKEGIDRVNSDLENNQLEERPKPTTAGAISDLKSVIAKSISMTQLLLIAMFAIVLLVWALS
jgi:hypothetical protein